MATGSSLLRAPERLAYSPTDRLAALERVWRRFDNPETLLSCGGRVVEISPTHYKV
ncbi:MAG: flagellum-specific ATP synthase FliI, partial [Mesorhizobium sp.]